MAKTKSEKAAESLVEAVMQRDWDPYLYSGLLMQQHPQVQRIIIDGLVIFFQTYQRRAANPHLRFMTDEIAADQIEAVDLTRYDQ